MNTTTTTSSRAATSSWSDARRLRPRVGVAVLTVALLSASACGSDTTSDAAGIAPTSTTSTSTTSTMTAPISTPTTTTGTSAPVTPGTTVPIEVRPTEAFDELVGDEGARVHVRCTGSGATTVLLIAGFESGSEGWAKVEPAISAQTRVCSYDRPGTGTSDPAISTQTFTTQASDLHSLLSTIGEPGPYVVVGHSFGGAEATTFASLYSDEVTGLVLIDASPASWPAALCSVADDGSETAAMYRATCTGMFLPTGNGERLDVLPSFTAVAGIVSLGSLPMAVVTATDRQLAGLAATEVTHLTDVWNDGQQRWIDLSTAAHLVSVDNTSHDIQLDHPDVVIDEIARLLP